MVSDILSEQVRYIASYCDMEMKAIQNQDKGSFLDPGRETSPIFVIADYFPAFSCPGQGVILAATWILPVAIIPRPWDFPTA